MENDTQRWIDRLLQVHETLERKATHAGGATSLVGADPLTMERDRELDRALSLLAEVIDGMTRQSPHSVSRNRTSATR